MSKKHAVGTLIEYKGKFLILQRMSNDSFGGKWGLPAGGIEIGEDIKDAAVREIFEETGYRIGTSSLEHLDTFEWKFPFKTIVFSLFKVKISKPFKVKLNPEEHSDYKWVTPEECCEMNMIDGFQEYVLEKFYKI